MNARPEVECHKCEGTGWIEDSIRVDVDAYAGDDCSHCGGTGIEPPHKAGDRDTSPKPLWHNGTWPERGAFGDILEVLAKARAKLRAPYAPASEDYKALASLFQNRNITDAEANAAQAKRQASNRRDNYASLRRRAMCPVSQLALIEMIARSEMCATACDKALETRRAVA